MRWNLVHEINDHSLNQLLHVEAATTFVLARLEGTLRFCLYDLLAFISFGLHSHTIVIETIT